MNRIIYVFLIFLSFLISFVIVVFESSSHVYYGAENVYRVYLDGKSIGTIKNKEKLENYINKQQETIKAKYNVDNVYIPNSLKIQSETTYNEKKESVKSIYNKIKEAEDFTIDGYTMTITDKKEIQTGAKKAEEIKIKEQVYLLDKEILQNAIDSVVKSFVNEEDYTNYLNETKEDSSKLGSYIENVYIKEQITIKKGRIPVNKDIYTTDQDLAKFLLFGTNKKNKIHKVKEGETVKSIAYNNKMSTEELLIANKDIANETTLLYPGQEVVISYINPLITIVEDTHTVKNEDIRYKTIEKEDSNMTPGHSKVIQKGRKGKSKITRKIEKQNGKITQALIVSSEIITEPINKIVRTGGDVEWVWPTVSNYTITEHYGYGLRSSIGETSSRLHDGIDIAGLGCGSPIYAIGSGTVTIAGWYPGYGNAVQIKHATGHSSLYGHMNSVSVSVGQTVKKGQQVGRMGNTGYSFGCHLHLKTDYNGTSMDPLTLLK